MFRQMLAVWRTKIGSLSITVFTITLLPLRLPDLLCLAFEKEFRMTNICGF